MKFDNRVTRMTGVELPIVQAPMGWIARSQLASAVSNAGGLGIIETSSGELDNIRSEIEKMRTLTDKPFGVNIAQAFVRDPDIAKFIIDQGVRFVSTSAGSPERYTEQLKKAGLTVFHVVPNLSSALKAVEYGVDGLIVEGGEGGGFKNPRDVASMVLLPLVRSRVDVPIIAAGGLVDGAFAPQFGFQRCDCNAVRLHPAITAALADIAVDEDALVRVGKIAALAAAALFSGTGLDVNNGRYTTDFSELFLHFRQFVADVPTDIVGKVAPRGFFLGVKDQRDVAHPHGAQLAHDPVRAKPALVALPASHRHGVVVENLVGHGDARRHRRPDRQQARMVVGAVAQVLEHMAARRKRRLADPVRALTAHMGETAGFAVHPERHDMTADPGIGAAALGQLGRAVMRAAGAEIGQPRRQGLGIFGLA